MAESREETISGLRVKLGREPTADEIRAARDEVIRRAYAGMALTEILLRDEAKAKKKKKQVVEEESSDEESNTDGEEEDTSETDTDTDEE